jgi:hypothetical protein
VRCLFSTYLTTASLISFFHHFISIFFLFYVVPTEIEIRSLGWTKDEDSVIAVVNYLYKDPYGLMIQKALEAYRPFSFQSTISAPSLPNRPLNLHQNQNQGKGVTYGVQPTQAQFSSFPSRSTKHILDRVAWQQKPPQDEIFSADEITSNVRFALFLKEFRHGIVGLDIKENGMKEIKYEYKNEFKNENENDVKNNKKMFWTWAEREKVRTHLLYKKKNEHNNLSIIRYEDTTSFKERCSSAYVNSSSSGSDALQNKQEIMKEECWDGRNKIFFSSGAKRTWWSTQSQSQPSLQHQPSVSLSSPQPSSALPTSRTSSSTFFPPFPSDQPTLDLDSFLFSNPGVDSDDLDLEFGFGVDEKDDDFFQSPSGDRSDLNLDPNSSMILDENISQKSLNSGLDSGSFCGRLVTERLFTFSSDYLRDLDLLNNEATPAVTTAQSQLHNGTRKINIVVANMKAAIKEAEGKKPPPPVIPGKPHYHFYISTSTYKLTIELLYTSS